jgi:hypothetical protein
VYIHVSAAAAAAAAAAKAKARLVIQCWDQAVVIVMGGLG